MCSGMVGSDVLAFFYVFLAFLWRLSWAALSGVCKG